MTGAARGEAPLILALDASAAQCAAAVLSGGRVLARAAEEMTRGQAERLMPMARELLHEAGAAPADLTAIAVCTGPGNFTGVRLAVAAARGLAMALGRPAIGVTRFEALAAAAGGARRVAVLLGARRGEIAAQVLDIAAADDPQALGAPFAAAPGALAARLASFSPDLVIGPEAAALAQALGAAAGAAGEAVDPAALGRVARARLSRPFPRPAPVYLRPADAAPPREAPPPILGAARR